ncbi:MAG TPA: hypothetical protein VN253_05055, partial [Kofleriaceae bacterium]|nr:hypothetical protein [Kofleriaceae bacterium]
MRRDRHRTEPDVPEEPALEQRPGAPRARGQAWPAWRELLVTWPRAPRPPAGRPAVVEYVLQTT